MYCLVIIVILSNCILSYLLRKKTLALTRPSLLTTNFCKYWQISILGPYHDEKVKGKNSQRFVYNYKGPLQEKAQQKSGTLRAQQKCEIEIAIKLNVSTTPEANFFLKEKTKFHY